MLFDHVKRRPLERSAESLSIFESFNQFEWYGSTQLRNELEDWFSRYPKDDRSDLHSRFRSNNDYNPDGAFFELACHELLSRLGFKLEVHPTILGSNNHPDFLARSVDGNFYLEATVTGKRDGPFTLHANKQAAIKELNTLTSDDFYIGIEMQGELKTTLPKRSKRQIVGVFRELLNSYTRDEVSYTISMGRTYDAPSRTVTHGDWTLQGWLVPISDAEKVARRSQMVIYPFTAARTGVVDSVRKALDDKRKKYGTLKEPSVIAVNVRDMFYNGKNNDMEVLLGDQVIAYPVGDPCASGTLRHKQNGIWYRSRKIDAVLICKSFDIWNLRNASGCLYIHTTTDKADFHDGLLQIPHAVTDQTDTRWFPSLNLARLLGIDENGLFT